MGVFGDKPDDLGQGRAQGIEGYLYMALIASSTRALGIRHRKLRPAVANFGGR